VETKWYTAKELNATFSFSAPGENTPVVHLEDWTVELLLKSNGPKFGGEEYIFGVQAAPRETVQDIRQWMEGSGKGDFGNLCIQQGAIGSRDDIGFDRNKLSIGTKEWHWVHLVFESGKSLTTYRDGEQLANIPTKAEFNKKHDMNLPAIFTASRDEQHRNFNGSIAIFWVYDRALTAAEVMKNIKGTYAIESAGKLAITWGDVKTRLAY
jgi:hypothetical protein